MRRLYDLARDRGIVVNYAKSEIESSFRRPVFVSDIEQFRDLLAGVSGFRSDVYPGLHLTHAEYDQPPERFGSSGRRRGFHFFLDIDGIRSLESARRTAEAMADHLSALEVPHWVQFSGREGFHIHIPGGAFPRYLDGQSFVDVAPGIFPDIKHSLIRAAAAADRDALSDVALHPRAYHPTSQGIQRMPFSIHEGSGRVSLPLLPGELGGRSSSHPEFHRDEVGPRLDVALELSGGVDGLLSALESERDRKPPSYIKGQPLRRAASRPSAP